MKLLPAKLSPEAAPAGALLRQWDCGIAADSAAALLYEQVMPELSTAFRDLVIPKAAHDLLKTMNLSEMLRLLANPDRYLGADPVAARDALLDKALAAGWAKAVELAGPDPAQWRWGDLHHVSIAHPLSASPAIAAAFPKIDGGRSGGVNPGRKNFNVMHGASYLLVADVGAWDNSRVLLLPGQSGDPRSPHYRDWYQDWLTANAQPLWFSKAAVDAHVVTRTMLTPA